MRSLIAQVAVAGYASVVRGPVLRLDRPFSFWGGVDPETGSITDKGSRHAGRSVAGAVFVVPEPRGSSSSSAVLLELVAQGIAPAAIILGRIDAIAGLGLIVAREMGYAAPPLLILSAHEQAGLQDGRVVEVHCDGAIVVTP